MRPSPAWPGLWTMTFSLVVFAVLGAGIAWKDGLPKLDAQIEEELREWDPGVREGWLRASFPADLPVSIIVVSGAVTACLVLGSRRNAALMLLAVLLDLSVRLLKLAYGYPRPEDGATNPGFPSGHAARGMGIFGLALFLVHASWTLRRPGPRRVPPQWTSAWLALAVLIAVARVLGGVHWASDAAAGLAYGLAFVAVGNHFAQRPPTDAAPPDPSGSAGNPGKVPP